MFFFRDNVCSYRPQAQPSQARVSFNSPSLGPHLSSNTGTSFQTPPRPPLNSNPVLFSNLQGASSTPVNQLQVHNPGSGGSWQQFNSLGALPSQTNIAQGKTIDNSKQTGTGRLKTVLTVLFWNSVLNEIILYIH